MFVFKHGQLTEWLVVFVDVPNKVVKYSFCHVLFATVELDRVKRLQTAPLSVSGSASNESSNTTQWIYKMANKTENVFRYDT